MSVSENINSSRHNSGQRVQRLRVNMPIQEIAAFSAIVQRQLSQRPRVEAHCAIDEQTIAGNVGLYH
jgi:hypothetical protein